MPNIFGGTNPMFGAGDWNLNLSANDYLYPLIGGAFGLLSGGGVRNVLGGLMAGWSAQEQQRVQDEAAEAVQAQIDELRARHEGLYGRVMPAVESLSGDIMRRGDDIKDILLARMRGFGEEELGLGKARELGVTRDVTALENELQRLYRGIGERYGQRARLGAEQAARLASTVTGRYGQRRRDILEQLAGLGAQEERDIREDFRRLGAAQEADLAARGMGGTTVGQTMGLGRQRELSEELGRLGERLQRERIGLEADLTRQELQALERGGARALGIGLDLSGQELAALEREQAARRGMGMARIGTIADVQGQYLNQLAGLHAAQWEKERALKEAELQRRLQLGLMPTQYDIDLTRDYMGFLGGIQHQIPQQAPMLALMRSAGLGMAEPPSPPSTDWATPAIAGGAAVLSSLITKLPFGCIDAGALVLCSDGPKRLRDVRLGDQVLCPDGRYRQVRYVDYGAPAPQRLNHYITITTTGAAITLTRDHVIDGRPAGEYRKGDAIGSWKVLAVKKAEPRPSADLWLRGGTTYLANGFPIESMIIRALDPNHHGDPCTASA